MLLVGLVETTGCLCGNYRVSVEDYGPVWKGVTTP